MTSPDPYWSRTGSQPEIADRVDPVCWGGPPGPLDDEQLTRFEQRGFLVMPGLLRPDEAQALLDESHALATALRGSDSPHVITEPDSQAVRSVFRVHEDSAPFAQLVKDDRLAGVARQVLASQVYVHQSRINLKPGFEGRPFGWHSDFETWHIEDGMPRMRALSASLFLTENRSVNGPLMLVPGSHRRYVRCLGETPEDHYKQSLREQRYGVPDLDSLRQLIDDGGIVEATGPAGTVVFFDCNTMHGSAGNLSPYPRHNVFLVFNSVENRLTEPFGGTAARPDFLGARAVHPEG